MATDISTVKSSIVTDSVIPSSKGSAQSNGKGIDFAEIIRNNGTRMDSGLNALSDRAGITGVSERSANAPLVNDHSQDRASDNNDNGGNRADTDDHVDRPSDRDVSSQNERPNDYISDRSHDSRPETAEPAHDAHDNSQHAENNGENSDRDERPSDTSSNDNGSSKETDSTEAAHAPDSDNGEQSAAKGDGQGEENAGTVNKGETGATNAAQILNSMLANAQGNALPGQANGQAQENTQSGPAKANAAEGLNTAAANVGKQAEGASTSNGQSNTNSNNAQGQTQTHNLANTPAQAQTQNTANTATQTPGDAQIKDTTKAAEQAAQIAKMVGNGNKVDVSVTVTDEKSTLVSKPSASLVAGTVLAAETNTPSLRAQQTQGANNATGQGQNQQVANQAAGVAGQAQQAVQQAAGSQTQATNTAAIDAKAAVQGNLHSGGAQATVSGNGETPVATAPSGSTTAAQQAQQNTSTQAANSSRFTTANPALTDQVSVQISKAINAGNDKISIQLKPAEMGRVDVKMEIGHDGRVTAVVTADNKGTLDLLQKDAKELQQALQQAGLQVDNDGLSFNLREQGEGQDMAGNSANGGEQGIDDGQGNELSLEEELAGLDRNIITDSSIDVRA